MHNPNLMLGTQLLRKKDRPISCTLHLKNSTWRAATSAGASAARSERLRDRHPLTLTLPLAATSERNVIAHVNEAVSNGYYLYLAGARRARPKQCALLHRAEPCTRA